MALPRKLKYFNIFENGESFLGECTEITLPKLTQKMESYRAGGMIGEVSISMGLEKAELTFKCGGYMENLRKKFGGNIDDISLTFAGSFQRDDSGEVTSIEATAKGRFSEIDGGTYKAGDNTEESYKCDLVYYKETVDGRDILEIDYINMVFKVDGKDMLEKHRKAIGM